MADRAAARKSRKGGRPFGSLGRAVAWSALVSLLLLKSVDPWPLELLRNATFDWLERSRSQLSVDAPVSVVDIDDASLQRLGQWPWPRRLLADLVDRLASAGASLVVFDMVFAEPDRLSPADDVAFAAALGRLPSVGGLALIQNQMASRLPARAGFALSGPDPGPHLPSFAGAVVPLAEFSSAFAGCGALNGLPDRDGKFRRMPLLFSVNGGLYPSVVAETVRLLKGETTYRVKTAGGSGEGSLHADSGVVALHFGRAESAVTIPTDANGAMLLRQDRFPAGRVVPAWRVLDTAENADAFARRIVIIGSSAFGLADMGRAVSGPIPGVEFHAQALRQILVGDFLLRPDWSSGFEVILAFALGAILILTLPQRRTLPGLALVGGILASLLAIEAVLFDRAHWLFDPVYPAISVVCVFIVVTIGKYVETERERLFIRRAFAHYLSPSLVSQLAADPGQLKLGGQRRDMSFIYTDIAGFTALAERLGPERLTPIVNAYFDGMSAAIVRHDGMVAQFAGDTVLAYFNAPLDQADHAARAVACARDLDAFAEDFRRRQAEAGVSFGQTRISVHSGPAVVGNFGSAERFQYAALGDTVNAAARLEGLNKFFGTRVCTSADTLARCGDMSVRPLGRVRVQGKSEPIDVFEILSTSSVSSQFMQDYREAYAVLGAGDIGLAVERFARLVAQNEADGPSRLHLTRLNGGHCNEVIVMTAK